LIPGIVNDWKNSLHAKVDGTKDIVYYSECHDSNCHVPRYIRSLFENGEGMKVIQASSFARGKNQAHQIQHLQV
jgi:hypothetical protein